MKIIFISISIVVLSLFSCQNDTDKPALVEETVSTTDSIQELNLDEINQQIVDNPNSSNGFYRRSVYYSKNNEIAKAMDDIDRALIIDPEVDFLNLERAKLLLVQDRFTDAALFTDKAIQINPENFDAHLLLGKLKYLSGDLNGAIQSLDEALKLDKFNYQPYFIKGMVFESSGAVNDTIKAATSYQTAIEQNPDFFDAYYKLAALYYKRKPELAIQYLEQALVVIPNNIDALRALNSLYIDNQNFEKSLSTLANMISIDPGYSESYFLKGQTYILMLDENASKQTIDTTYNQAINFFDKAIELYPEYEMAYYLKASCYEELGQKNKAIEFYTKALDINPKYEQATEALRAID